ncbi:CppA N-terminal domain-containing protein [Streptococcus merionis]|uniref:CppA N-terminal domain-containing protein n=1 Tax=Streptococcus merionis TaxID=400065 RepID=UPI0026EC3430|nr:CppA N-terminal domain-containing protein [Streptococcus merionis]
MNKIETVSEFVPILKLNNRSLNLDFYTNTLGLKVINEENAFADLSDHGSSAVKLILEESPSMRSRQVKGPKKLAKLVLKAAVPEEVELLLYLGANYLELYRGPKGWGFSALSPEGDLIVLHSEDSVSDLMPYDGQPTFKKVTTEFAGLSHVEVEMISVNTPQSKDSQALFAQLFETEHPVKFVAAEGEDLQVANNLTWDLVGLEVQVAKRTDFLTVKDWAEQQTIGVFLDKKDRFLVLTELNGLEVTLRK